MGTDHWLVLKPTVMYLLCFSGKEAERRGKSRVFFQKLRDLCLVGECQQLIYCKHSFDILSPGSELRPEQTPQSPETEESRGKRRSPAHWPAPKSAPELTGAAGTQDASFPELGVTVGPALALGVTPIEGTQGRTAGDRSFPGGKIQHSHPSCLLPLNLRQKFRGRESLVGLPGGQLPAWGCPGPTS